MANGTVKFFNAIQGVGVISPDIGPGDVFVHISALERAGIERLRYGQRVAFKVELDRHGRAAAQMIELIGDDACSAMPIVPRRQTSA